jgi:ABC-type lipoprotein export system ATPase subunit
MLISLKDISKTYRVGEVEIQALRGVTLDIAQGDFLAIMGASGSGKSTLLNLIGCLDAPTGGEYLLEGDSIGSLDVDGLALIRNRKIGFVFQNFNLLPRTTALENVELPLFYGVRSTRQAKSEKAMAMLTRLGIGDRTGHYPSQLSGGQQQRVAIARALINDPPLILADEPTGNLDSRSSEEIMTIFRELNQDGITVVMVTHENDIAAHAKHTIHMRDGVIV